MKECVLFTLIPAFDQCILDAMKNAVRSRRKFFPGTGTVPRLQRSAESYGQEQLVATFALLQRIESTRSASER